MLRNFFTKTESLSFFWARCEHNKWTFRCVFWVLITWPVCWCSAEGVRLYLSSALTCRLGPPKWPRLHPRRAIFPVATCNFRINRARNKLNAITHNLNLSRFLPCCSWRTMLRVCQLPSGWIFHLRLGCQTFFISSFLHTWFHSSTFRSFQSASSNIIFVAGETYVKRQHFRPSRKKRTYHLFWPQKKKHLLLRGAMCIRNIWNPIV